jgi:TolB-like protein/Flp pilus assembly protein TadD
MAAEVEPGPQLEIGHVLFIDIVGYSKLVIDDQRELQQQLNQIVRGTEQFRTAESAGKLVRLPTGDGMALVFFTGSEAPVQCALEISEAGRSHPQLKVRMGVNTGPVSGVTDVNDRANIAGAGINIAQRVMDIGDAGHILLSKRAAEDLVQYRRWQAHLHDLGEVEVKHGVKVPIVNFYTGNLGNPQLPQKLKEQRRKQVIRRRLRLTILATVLILAAALPLLLPMMRRVAQSSTSTLANIPAKSIAILPFQNLSDEKQNAYFADGVQDEILTNLAKVADLKVISRTSVMQYRDAAKRNLRRIASELGVAHVLEGSVQRVANRVRVIAQLIDARTDAHLWAETYDRDLADVFAIQTEIASTIAAQLQAKLSDGEKAALAKPPTKDFEAYDLYLRADALYADTADPLHAKEKLPQAADLLNQALARDPQFLLAWYLLSRIHTISYFQGHDHTPGRLELAKAAVDSALLIQPEAGEGHLALADYYYHGFRDYARARDELAIARKTLPNAAELFELTGYVDYRDGRWESATRNLERAAELDPRNFHTIIQLALCYQPQRRYQDESRTYERALTVAPGDAGTRMLKSQVAANWKADMKPFQTTFAKVVAENPDAASDIDDPFYSLRERTSAAAARLLKDYPADGVETYGISYPHAYWEGVVARWQGDAAKAQAAFNAARATVEKVLQKQPDFPAALSLLGLIDAGLGRKEEAIHEGRRACELLPISKDAVDGVAFVVNLAQIYAWTGEKDLAIEQLAAAEKVPNDCHYGELRLHPIWDPLRGYPPFEHLVASLAPRD